MGKLADEKMCTIALRTLCWGNYTYSTYKISITVRAVRVCVVQTGIYAEKSILYWYSGGFVSEPKLFVSITVALEQAGWVQLAY
jgi:hypothetical protein